MIRKPRKARRKPGDLAESAEPAAEAMSVDVDAEVPGPETAGEPVKAEESASAAAPIQEIPEQASNFVPEHVIPYIRAKKGSKAASVASGASEDSVQPKKRKRVKKPTFPDAENGSGSDDEVMPTASTSRSRRVARAPVRSVKMSDLVEGFGTPQQRLPPEAQQPASASVSQANASSAPLLQPAQAQEPLEKPAAAAQAPVAPPARSAQPSPPAKSEPFRYTHAQLEPVSSPGSRTALHREPSPPKLPSLQEALSPKHVYVASTDIQPTRIIPLNGGYTASLPPLNPRLSPISHHTLPPISHNQAFSPYYPPRERYNGSHSDDHSHPRRHWEDSSVAVKTAGDVFKQLRGSPTSTATQSPVASTSSATQPYTPSYAASPYSAERTHFPSFSELNKQYAPPPSIATPRSPDLGRPPSVPHRELQRQHGTSPFIPGHTHVAVRTADSHNAPS